MLADFGKAGDVGTVQALLKIGEKRLPVRRCTGQVSLSRATASISTPRRENFDQLRSPAVIFVARTPRHAAPWSGASVQFDAAIHGDPQSIQFVWRRTCEYAFLFSQRRDGMRLRVIAQE